MRREGYIIEEIVAYPNMAQSFDQVLEGKRQTKPTGTLALGASGGGNCGALGTDCRWQLYHCRRLQGAHNHRGWQGEAYSSAYNERPYSLSLIHISEPTRH